MRLKHITVSSLLILSAFLFMEALAQGHWFWAHLFPEEHALTFTFEARDVGYRDRSVVHIRATLHNYSADTVWYMTTTCNGLEFNFVSTGKNWILNVSGYCNIYSAIKCNIPPGGDTTFTTSVDNLRAKKKISLGFNLLEVDAQTPANRYSSGSIQEELQKRKKVLWAGPVKIE